MRIGYAYIIAGFILLFSSVWFVVGLKFAIFLLGAFAGTFLITAGVIRCLK